MLKALKFVTPVIESLRIGSTGRKEYISEEISNSIPNLGFLQSVGHV